MDHVLADLHIHSCFSDGTMDPAEIAERAAENGVSLLAITDHNVLEGARMLADLPLKPGMHRISGVELDTMWRGMNLHVLGYGVDLYHPALCAMAQRCSDLLEQVNVLLIRKAAAQDPRITEAGYEAFFYDRKLGGWKALHYFMAQGLTHSLQEGFGVYGAYRHDYTCVAWPPVGEVCGAIHEAGGKAVLAHPGKSIKGSQAEVLAAVRELTAAGIDGAECYYPAHDLQLTAALAAFCRENSLLVTSGCDCHGAFQATDIGQMKIPASLLTLDGIAVQ